MSYVKLPLLVLGLFILSIGIFRRFDVALVLPHQPKSVRTAADPAAGVDYNSPMTSSEVTRQHSVEAYGTLPLIFEANQGQTDTQVDFLSRGRDYTLFLSPTEVGLSIVLPQSGQRTHPALPSYFSSSKSSPKTTALRMELLGANPHPAKAGMDELPGKVNYFLGKDPAKWRSNIATYAKVKYQDVYPGVDLVYYGNQRQLEYDFVVAPRVDPKSITLNFEGVDHLKVDAEGNLVLLTSGGPVLQMHKPLVYQDTDNGRQEIPGGYVLDKHRVSFQIGDYDAARPLVIDPVFAYSTRFGGGEDDGGWAIATDTAGNVYLTGDTNSTAAEFPVAKPLQKVSGGSTDIFVAKLTADGSQLLYSTYLGGSKDDVGYGIALDPTGNIYITGDTSSPDFPLANPVQKAIASTNAPDVIVAKLSADGSNLLYSTYIGGNFGERGNGIAVDSTGHACVVGYTNSTNFPTVKPFQAEFASGQADAFVFRLTPDGSALVYSTYYGGGKTPPDRPDFGTAIAVDTVGNAYITGFTNAPDFPAVRPLFNFQGPTDVFVAKIDPAGAPIYSTFLGGIADDEGMGIAVDAAGNAYVTGETESLNFPTTDGAFRRTCTPVPTRGQMRTICLGGDAFISKLSPDGSALIYSTYLNGQGFEVGRSIAVDSAGSAYVTGFTESPDFATVDPLQKTFGGGKFDAFVLKMNPGGTALTYSTYLGGSGTEGGYGIAVDGSGNAYVTGYTESPDFPIRRPLRNSPKASPGRDAFVTKIADRGVSR